MGLSTVLNVEAGSLLESLALAAKNGQKSGDKSSGGGSPTTPAKSTSATENISRVPTVPRASASSVTSNYRGIYDQRAVDSDLDENKRRQAEIDASYTDNPEEWNRRDPYWDWNHAKDSKRGNLNGMSFRDTRLHSRLADALNNERHLKPTDIGRRTLHMGATGTGADQAGSERWEPIETQEMRQMRANERLDEIARGNDIERQRRIEDYPLDLREKMDEINMDLAKYAAQTGIDVERAMQKAIQTAEYSDSWSTYWSSLLHQFMQEYDLDISERVFAKLASIDDYPLQQMYALYKKGISVPTKLVRDYNKYVDGVIEEMRKKGATEKELWNARVLLELQASLFMGGVAGQGLVSGANLALGSIGGMLGGR